ncbi:MAG: FAD-dependent oxidoreductase [Chloroherpetonaceae bacterium]
MELANARRKSVLVVGAGISGLLAATVLKENGVDVLVVDKGRGAGGRMSTRRIDLDDVSAYFDHGAQYFTISDSDFAKYVERWLALGIIKPLDEKLIRENGEPALSDEPRYIGTTGMNAITKYLADGLQVKFSERVDKLTFNQHWIVETDKGRTFKADAVVLSQPVPQSLELITKSDIRIEHEVETELGSIDYHPCIATMLLFEGIEPVLPYCGIWFRGEPIAWACDNLRKGISSLPTLTIHAGPMFSAEHWQTPDVEIVDAMLEPLKGWIKVPVKLSQVHRWRYSFAKSVLDKPFVRIDSPAPLMLIGDGFVAPRVEGAAISGIRAAHALLKEL